MSKIEAIWRRLVGPEDLNEDFPDAGGTKRSSHVIAPTSEALYIFGGELEPRRPVDNKLYQISLQQNAGTNKPRATRQDASPDGPSPRVGSASTTVDSKMYMFSGRGGSAMVPIEEHGALWVLDLSSKQWSLLHPADTTKPYPPARSYHCMANDGSDEIFLHAGCPETGRLSDLWCFQITLRRWTQLSPAPDPPRGGASLACVGGKLYRMNGFDGKTEQGGVVDVYDMECDSWVSQRFEPDGVKGPTARSVSVLLPVNVEGNQTLVTMFGERDPSALGHQGAGKMLGDVWLYDIASGTWTEVEVGGNEENRPCARGWFAADVLAGPDGDSIVLHGGLGESNERLGDIWILSFELD